MPSLISSVLPEGGLICGFPKSLPGLIAAAIIRASRPAVDDGPAVRVMFYDKAPRGLTTPTDVQLYRVPAGREPIVVVAPERFVPRADLLVRTVGPRLAGLISQPYSKNERLLAALAEHGISPDISLHEQLQAQLDEDAAKWLHLGLTPTRKRFSLVSLAMAAVGAEPFLHSQHLLDLAFLGLLAEHAFVPCDEPWVPGARKILSHDLENTNYDHMHYVELLLRALAEGTDPAVAIEAWLWGQKGEEFKLGQLVDTLVPSGYPGVDFVPETFLPHGRIEKLLRRNTGAPQTREILARAFNERGRQDVPRALVYVARPDPGETLACKVKSAVVYLLEGSKDAVFKRFEEVWGPSLCPLDNRYHYGGPTCALEGPGAPTLDEIAKVAAEVLSNR